MNARTAPPRTFRCAIYTRVSSDAGLDQDFNSLDNQREAAEAYIKSQAHEGWRLAKGHYDDGGFSGGSIDRPALRRLTDQIRARQIDIVVVYKVDRLTRSLADFAKLVELFDQHDVSFVSVTQAFNTTNSMGRLTLNVLLSFAQFEREVTGERIRDKIAASKRKGMWMGGVVPYGYRAESRKLIVVEEEACQVREIFEQYLELRSLPALVDQLRQQGFTTRVRPSVTGISRGGAPIMVGALAALLRNRVYRGEIRHKNLVFAGEHQAIVDLTKFDEVQRILDENNNAVSRVREDTGAILMGKIFDSEGSRLTPSYACKGSARYRYYVGTRGGSNEKDKTKLIRVSAPSIEAVVANAVRERIVSSRSMVGDDTMVDAVKSSLEFINDREVIEQYVRRVIVRPTSLDIDVSIDPPNDPATETLNLPWQRKHWSKRDVIGPGHAGTAGTEPIRAEARARMLYGVARARAWVERLTTGELISVEQIAAIEGCSARSVRMTISLAFLPPDIVRSAIAGTLADGAGVSTLFNPELIWDSR